MKVEPRLRPVADDDLPLPQAGWLIVAVVSCANLIPVWAFRFFAGQDTPNHLYGSEMIRVLLHGGAPPAVVSTFAPALTLKSNVFFQLAMEALGGIGVRLDVAHRLFLSAYAVGLPVAGLYCLNAINRQARVLALLLLPLVWNWFAVQGLYNYVISLVPALLWLGIVGRDGGRPGRAAQVGLMFLAVSVYLAHSLTFMAMLLVSGVRVLFPGDESSTPLRSRMGGAAPLAIGLAPALTIAAATIGGTFRTGSPGEPTLSSFELYSLVEAVGAFFVEFAMRYHVRDLLALGPPLAALIGIPLWAAWRDRRQGQNTSRVDDATAPLPSRLASPLTSPLPRWPLLSATLLAIVYLVAPHIMSGSDVSPRLRPLIVFSLMCYSGIRLAPRARRVVAALALVCGLGGAGILAVDFARFGHDLDDFTSGIPFIPEGSRVYPMVFDPRGSSLLIRPMLHAWGYYGVERHVVTPFAFAWHENRFPFRYRELPLHEKGSALPSDAEDEPYALVQGRLCESTRRLAPSLPCSTVRSQGEARLVELGLAYDYLLTWAAPVDFAPLLENRGYHLVHARGALCVYSAPNPSHESRR